MYMPDITSACIVIHTDIT